MVEVAQRNGGPLLKSKVSALKSCLCYPNSSSIIYISSRNPFLTYSRSFLCSISTQTTTHRFKAMEVTRSFHLIETLDTLEITLNHVEGQNMVSWENIENVFPGVRRIRNGSSVIKFHRSSSQQR